MQDRFKSIQVWLMPSLAALALIVSVVCVLVRRSGAAAAIRQCGVVGAHLTDMASRAIAGAITPEKAQALDEQALDLTQRMEDSKKPGLFQAQLVEAAGRSQLRVREIRPTSLNGIGMPKVAADARLFPTYRVSVEGTYQRIATFMDDVKSQRLPARVLGFRVTGVEANSDAVADALSAEIDIEAFQPPQLRPAEAPKP